MAELKPLPGGYYVWHYLPSRPLSILFIAFFFLITSAICWRMIKTKTWYVSVLCIGGLFEVIGFAARAYCLDNTDQLIPYIIQSTFVLLAPALFAASIYMVLGRTIIRIRAEKYSFIRVNWLTKIFVFFDVLSFIVQGSGAGLMASADNAKTAEGIVVGGLFIQIIAFAIFMATMVVVQRRVNANPTVEARDPESGWRQDIYMLYATSALVMLRSVFRVIEFIMGYDGYLLQNEWPFYVFDAVPMLVLMIIFFVQYPGQPSLLKLGLSKLTKRRNKGAMELQDMA